jgi:hypothetical protein
MKRKLWTLLLLFPLLAALGLAYHYCTRPFVFNESCWEHAHCIKIAGLTLLDYAGQHGGRFPYHPKGYGNALLLLDEDVYFTLTGPGHDDAPFYEAKRKGTNLPEEACGRVYVQGLTMKSNPEIALLFDKLPTPGGDHCHLPFRLWAPLGREVWLVGGSMEFVPESDWPDFAEEQVELLVREGWQRHEAERLFAVESMEGANP